MNSQNFQGQADNHVWVDEKDASPILGLALSTLRNDRHTRRLGIPYYKVGRAVRYKVADLVDFMEARRVDPRGVAP